MKEFNLSNTPDTSALIITRGEVQPNHANNFGKVMQYGGELAIITTTELEEAIPLVGMRLAYRGVYEEMVAMHDHRRKCATWIAEHVSEQFGLKPLKYDVHLLDGAPDMPDAEGFDGLRPHWRGIAHYLTRKDRSANSLAAIWKYHPFSLVDKELERFGQEESEGRPTIEQLVEELQANRLPVRYKYAAAILDGKHGDLDAAKVTFTYPTVAKFQRTRSVTHGTVNPDGDHVLSTTEVSSRSYAPEISVELQIALDDARAAGEAAIQKGIEEQGDWDMFVMTDDGTTDYNNEARLAPIHNMI